MEQIKSPTEFLKDYGIEMEKTTLVCCIDNVMKQPSLSYLMKQYAEYVLNHYKNQNIE